MAKTSNFSITKSLSSSRTADKTETYATLSCPEGKFMSDVYTQKPCVLRNDNRSDAGKSFAGETQSVVRFLHCCCSQTGRTIGGAGTIIHVQT